MLIISGSQSVHTALVGDRAPNSWWAKAYRIRQICRQKLSVILPGDHHQKLLSGVADMLCGISFLVGKAIHENVSDEPSRAIDSAQMIDVKLKSNTKVL